MAHSLQQLGASTLCLCNVMSQLWLIATQISKLSGLIIIKEKLTHYWSCLSPGEGQDLEPRVGERTGMLLTAFCNLI